MADHRDSAQEVTSTFQRRPAYRYIRRTDRLSTYAEVLDLPLAEIIARVRLFNPTGAGTWWIAAYDPDTQVAWGATEIVEREIGPFNMAELTEYRGMFGLPIERDVHFTPVSLAAVLEGAR